MANLVMNLPKYFCFSTLLRGYLFAPPGISSSHQSEAWSPDVESLFLHCFDV